MRADHSHKVFVGLLALALLFTLARPAQASGGGTEFMQVVDGYQVHLVLAGNLAPGVLPVDVHLSDEHGQPVSQAQVDIVHTNLDELVAAAHAAADAHGAGDTHGGHSDTAADSHSAAGSDGSAHTETTIQDESVPHTHDTGVLFQLAPGEAAGAYTGSVIFFKAAQYEVNVVFTIAGLAHTAHFLMEVRGPDAAGTVLAVFAGLNVAIVGTAAMLKRKSAAA